MFHFTYFMQTFHIIDMKFATETVLSIYVDNAIMLESMENQ